MTCGLSKYCHPCGFLVASHLVGQNVDPLRLDAIEYFLITNCF